jgi:hypothetical protein
MPRDDEPARHLIDNASPPRFEKRLREAVLERYAVAVFGVDDHRRHLACVGIEDGELVGQDAVSPLAFVDPFGVDTDDNEWVVVLFELVRFAVPDLPAHAAHGYPHLQRATDRRIPLCDAGWPSGRS